MELSEPRIDEGSGLMTVDAFATRTGVFVYKRADGTVTRELRHPDDVFAMESLETLQRKMVTDKHPKFGKITIDNARHTGVGMSGDIVDRSDDGRIRVPLTIFDRNTIKAMRGDAGRPGRRQVSCGYTQILIKENGEHNGEKYDHRQTNIRYNHIALVDRGRAGANVGVRMDADGAVDSALGDVCYLDNDVSDDDETNDPPSIPNGRADMKTKIQRPSLAIGGYRADALDVEIGDDSVSAVKTVLDRLDAAHEALRDAEARADKLTGERDALKSDGEDLQKKLDEATGEPPVEVIEMLAQDRAELLAIARHLKIDSIDGKRNDDIRKMIVQARFKDIKMDDLSDDNIQGRYDVIHQGLQKELEGLDSLTALGVATRPGKNRRADASDKNSGAPGKSPREKFLERMENASKPDADKKENDDK